MNRNVKSSLIGSNDLSLVLETPTPGMQSSSSHMIMTEFIKRESNPGSFDHIKTNTIPGSDDD